MVLIGYFFSSSLCSSFFNSLANVVLLLDAVRMRRARDLMIPVKVWLGWLEVKCKRLFVAVSLWYGLMSSVFVVTCLWPL